MKDLTNKIRDLINRLDNKNKALIDEIESWLDEVDSRYKELDEYTAELENRPEGLYDADNFTRQLEIRGLMTKELDDFIEEYMKFFNEGGE